MAGMNQQLNDRIETVFLMADVSLQPIASRLVKEIARYGGAIDKFVTPAVAADVARQAWQIALSAARQPRCASRWRPQGWGVNDDQSFVRVAFSGVGPDRGEARAGRPPQPPVSLIAPAEVAADPANRWTLELSNGGTVVDPAAPRHRPAACLADPAADRAGLLQRPRPSTA